MQQVYVLNTRARSIAAREFIGEQWALHVERGAPLVVTIETYESIRTLEQNRLYWATLREIAASAVVDGKRFPQDTWHEFFKSEYIGLEEVTLPNGQVLKRPVSTTTLNKAQFSEYVERVMAYAATELGLETY
jgi:hypothetical protein